MKYLRVAVALFIIFLSGGGAAYAYYTPVATIQVSINPSIELKTNCFDKIIKSSAINADGKTLLKNLQLKNKNIDEAMTLVVKESKKYNFINDNYNAQGKTISVKISAKNSAKIINLDKFQQYITQNKINTKIDDNGKKTNQEFIKIDESINKEAPADNSNSQNKNNDNSEKNKNKNKAEPSKIENEKGKNSNSSSNSSNSSSNGINSSISSNINDKSESKNKETEVPKNLPSDINHDKPIYKPVEDKVQSSKPKEPLDNRN